MEIAVRKRWNTTEVSTRLEAFAVAGSNVLSKFTNAAPTIIDADSLEDMMKTSKAKADYLKSQIRDHINDMLGGSFHLTSV